MNIDDVVIKDSFVEITVLVFTTKMIFVICLMMTRRLPVPPIQTSSKNVQKHEFYPPSGHKKSYK